MFCRINESADVRSNKALSKLYAQAMANLSSPVDCDFENATDTAGSTDQGKSHHYLETRHS